jgi:hypothetical protein
MRQPWWALSRFDVIWLALWLTVWYWHSGYPNGPLEWATRLAASFAGWFTSMWLIHRWNTR